MITITQDAEIVSNVTIIPPKKIVIEYSTKENGWTVSIDGVTAMESTEVGFGGDVVEYEKVFDTFERAMEWCDMKQLIKTTATAKIIDDITKKVHKRGKKEDAA